MSEMKIGKIENLSTDSNDPKSMRPSSSIKTTIVVGFVVVTVIFVGLGAWSATAPLARAVASYATLTVEGERKQIQHLEGGIVEALKVSEGQLVKKGELLMSLNLCRRRRRWPVTTRNLIRHWREKRGCKVNCRVRKR